MTCHSTDRMTAGPETSATRGRVAWAPARSLWTGSMTLAALALAPAHTTPAHTTPGAIVLFLATSAVALCLGHSIGLHRLLIHRSLATHLWTERLLAYLGTLVGMVRLHDTRDWPSARPPATPTRPASPPSLALQTPSYAGSSAPGCCNSSHEPVLFYASGGLPWLVWGIPVRIAVCLTGHWLVGHVTHRTGPASWVVDGAAVQGHDLPAAALVTFGEAWHGNHHAWPGSARLGLGPHQPDPGW